MQVERRQAAAAAALAKKREKAAELMRLVRLLACKGGIKLLPLLASYMLGRMAEGYAGAAWLHARLLFAEQLSGCMCSLGLVR